MRLSDGDVERIAEAVMKRIDEKMLVEELAVSIMRRTAQEMEKLRASVTNNPYHNPKPDCAPKPVKLSKKAKESLSSDAQKQTQLVKTLNERSKRT